MRWLHVMTVENLLSHQFIDDWLSFHTRIQLYCCKQTQKLLYFKDIDIERWQIWLHLYGSLNIFLMFLLPIYI